MASVVSIVATPLRMTVGVRAQQKIFRAKVGQWCIKCIKCIVLYLCIFSAEFFNKTQKGLNYIYIFVYLFIYIYIYIYI